MSGNFLPSQGAQEHKPGNTGPASGHVTYPAHGTALTAAVALLALPDLPS